jgi:DNA-binding response OmpR family regulator
MRERVLIVDDDPVVLEATCERLNQAGYEVFAREQALGTMQWVGHHQPDIVLLDVLMPALSGRDLAALLRKNEAAAGIILYSSMRGTELANLIKETGAIGAIQKTNDSLSSWCSSSDSPRSIERIGRHIRQLRRPAG